jgi:hypothetical protein
LWLTRIAYKVEGEEKYSKRDLNILAVKFKLRSLHSKNIRYEVIYKNLLRDIRKYFTINFNDQTDYLRMKKSDPE